jgi:CBS domain containing-hemolysin-like protein
MVNEGHEQGYIEANEAEMIHKIFEYGEKEAQDIMTNRSNIVAIDVAMSLEEALQFMLEEKHSRYPVIDETIDHIVGIIYLKDTMRFYNSGAPKGESIGKVEGLLRKAEYTPLTRNIDDLFETLQSKKLQMAIVIDEYGQTAGLVTMEDILEEIVGEINDEYDDEEKPYQRLNQNTYIFEAKTLISDFTKILNLDDDYFEHIEGEAETLAGLLLEIKGEFPIQGERINYKNFTFDVLEVDQRRIVKVKVIAHNK